MDNKAKMYIQEVEGTRHILLNFGDKWYAPDTAPSGCWGDVNLYGDLHGETFNDIVEKLRIQNSDTSFDEVDFLNGDFGEPIEQYEKKTIEEIEEIENYESDTINGDVHQKSFGLSYFTLIGDIDVDVQENKIALEKMPPKEEINERKSVLSELNNIKSEQSRTQSEPAVKKSHSVEL